MTDYYTPLAVVIATITSLAAVGLHYEFLTLLTDWIQKHSERGRVYVTVVCIIVAHVLEIQVFAIVYWLMDQLPEFGTINPVSSFYDYSYYSSVVYTTVGFGDLVPTGAMRVVTAIESLIGLVLITWSATFIYVNRGNLRDS